MKKTAQECLQGESTLEIMEKSYLSVTSGNRTDRKVSVDFDNGLFSAKVLQIKPEDKPRIKEGTRH